MIYQEKNYALLEEIHLSISHFFDGSYTAKPLELDSISEVYTPHSDINVDEVANAICWCAGTLKVLQEKRPVRCLDEVLSFSASVLEQRPLIQ